MKKEIQRLLLVFILVYATISAVGQNAPAFRQFYFNPYLFNPAFAGIEGYTDIYVFHRQQWLNFNNAPSASGFTVQYPTQNKVAYGFNFTSQEVVALRNTSAMLTFSYRVPLSANQFLFFGISGGVGANDLRLDELDYSNDPTIVNASTNSFYADGNFGVLYALGKLRIGFALPRLFGQENISPKGLGSNRYSQLINQLYSASYKFYFGSGNFALEPYFLYRLNRDNQNYWEGSALLYFKDKIWMGGSYNETQGAGFFFGLDVKEKLRVGYSYELPPVSPDFIAVNSHELHLRFRLGKKRVFKWAARFSPAPVEVAKANPVVTPPLPEQVIQDSLAIHGGEPRKTNEIVIQPIKEESAPVQKEDQPEVKPEAKLEEEEIEIPPVPVIETPARQPILAKGYYLIVASFGNPLNAFREKNRFISLGYGDAYVSQNQSNKLYYVYIFSSLDFELTRQARESYRLVSASRDAWILKID